MKFLEEIKYICEVDWIIVKLLKDLEDCCVEIIGLVDRKMVINVLNLGVYFFMVDFEDLNLLIWENVVEG